MFAILKVAQKPKLTREKRQSWSPTSIKLTPSLKASNIYNVHVRELSGSVVECLTRDREAEVSSLTGITALCHSARHINPSLVLVQPRKTRSYIHVTERLLMGRKESNQRNKTMHM